MKAIFSRRAKGMILLEVVMALSIFAAVAFALIMALDSATDAATDRNQIDAATVGLENQMAQIVSTRVTPVMRDLPSDHSGITYRLEIGPEPLQDDTQRSFPGFYRVTLKARWKVDSREESRELSELVYQP